jgi:NAD(P)-dependent dehydrogenase (short-subunit alcohol dehydrogenase family)
VRHHRHGPFAREIGSRKVTVNVVATGFVETDMTPASIHPRVAVLQLDGGGQGTTRINSPIPGPGAGTGEGAGQPGGRGTRCAVPMQPVP